MEIEAIRGPALSSVTQKDDAAVQALFAEQRSLLAVVRDNKIWQWLGGVPAGFGHPLAELYSIYCAFAFVGLFAITLIVAGFTRGPALWILFGLAVLCLLVRPLLTGPATKKTLALFARGVQLPAIIVRIADFEADGRIARLVVLVGKNVQSSDSLSALVVAGGQLRDYVQQDEATPRDLQPLVQSIRAHATFDGSRSAVPATVGKHYELAYLELNPILLPGETLDSQLLFVFADPDCRDAAHTRVVQCDLWGHGVEGLCNALPLEEVA